MSSFASPEKATTVRMPSTANLMLDSKDRNLGTSAGDFQITKTQNMLNGFFTRIATSEVVLEWRYPNISAAAANTVFGMTGTFSVVVGVTTYTVTVPDGNYTVKQALDTIVSLLNAAGTGLTWSISTTPVVSLAATGNFVITTGPELASRLGFDTGAAPASSQRVGQVDTPDLRPVRYLDFLSSQLTYNQDLKDSTTLPRSYDVLCRWYFANTDNSSQVLDAYGFPILPGYTPFCERRLFNPPKQIKWDPIQVMGNIAFEVYAYPGVVGPATSDDTYPFLSTNYDWLMTLQVSEN